MKKIILVSLTILAFVLLISACNKEDPVLGITPEVVKDSARLRYCTQETCLILEFLDDDLLHVEYAREGAQHDLSQPIWVSPMVYKSDYAGPDEFKTISDNQVKTASLKVVVNQDLCISITDITGDSDWQFAHFCPTDMEGYRKHLSIEAPDITDIYGLGEQFIKPGETDGNWFGKVRYPGVDQGNAMVGFQQGMVGNAQFSVAYFLGEALQNFALFIDNPQAQTWDLRKQVWDINVAGDALRFYVFTGQDLPEVRRDYMALTGTPPVPPKKMFGLWVSEYGFDNWEEMEEKLASLRANHFPVDGFVLDLQWFGGIRSDSTESSMGGLNWDTVNFPDPAGHIAAYREQGIGIMTIEEPYISAGLPEHQALAEHGYLVRQCEGCAPVLLTANPWWGIGGMMDWTNPNGQVYWHDTKRQPLIDLGIIGHWTDLGEPELFDPVSWYHGVEDGYVSLNNQYDIHNLYNLLWSKGIFEAYTRNEVEQRPFIMSRSGAPGSQRYAVSMWSGDIGANLESLAAHLQVQTQMSLSGMDYFGSDIGGFYRSNSDGNIDYIYTPWLASGALLDVPFRVHTQNLCNCRETAPDRVGDPESNLANVRLRYRLSPYLYSLAHRANLYGEALFPPLVHYYQQDEEVRELGNHKMIGRDLLSVHSAKLYQEYIDVYLPAGDWVDFTTGEWINSEGQWREKYPMGVNGVLQLPLFMRAGAIVPLMYVDDQTLNITGLRADGSVRDELILRIAASSEASSFVLYEDDGVSVAYQAGQVRTTLISQEQNGKQVNVTVSAAQGTFSDAPDDRDTQLELITEFGSKPLSVKMNGKVLPEAATETEWQQMTNGWFYSAPNLVLVKAGVLDVTLEKRFEINY